MTTENAKTDYEIIQEVYSKLIDACNTIERRIEQINSALYFLKGELTELQATKTAIAERISAKEAYDYAKAKQEGE